MVLRGEKGGFVTVVGGFAFRLIIHRSSSSVIVRYGYTKEVESKSLEI